MRIENEKEKQSAAIIIIIKDVVCLNDNNIGSIYHGLQEREK